MTALNDWLGCSGIEDGPVFRRVDRHGNLIDGRLGYSARPFAPAPAGHTTSHLATGYRAATMQGVESARYAAQVENWLRLRARAGASSAGRWDGVRKEKSNVAVFVSWGKSQHDDYCRRNHV